MTEIKRSQNIINILNKIGEKEDNHRKNKPKSKTHEFRFLPVMDIKTKFRISNKFDKKNFQKFLKEKDKCLESVKIDDRLQEEIGENQIYKIAKINPFNITFGM